MAGDLRIRERVVIEGVTTPSLEALSDESSAAHWETWTSAVITIARP